MAEHNRFLAVSDDSHIILLFCDLLDSGIAGIEQYIVDGSGGKGEPKVHVDKDINPLKNLHDADGILQEEEGFAEHIEHELKVVGDLDSVFVGAKTLYFFDSVSLCNSSLDVVSRSYWLIEFLKFIADRTKLWPYELIFKFFEVNKQVLISTMGCFDIFVLVLTLDVEVFCLAVITFRVKHGRPQTFEIF